MQNIMYSKVFKSFFIGISVMLYFFSGSISAQSTVSAKEAPKAKITLSNGAKITSTDGAFNNQVSANKIIHNETDVTYKKTDEGTNIMQVASTKPNVLGNEKKTQIAAESKVNQSKNVSQKTKLKKSVKSDSLTTKS